MPPVNLPSKAEFLASRSPNNETLITLWYKDRGGRWYNYTNDSIQNYRSLIDTCNSRGTNQPWAITPYGGEWGYDFEELEPFILYYKETRATVGEEREWAIPNREQMQADSQGKSMINVGIKRDKGKLVLVVDAKDFHEELDKIGCSHTNGLYDNRPQAAFSVANNRFEMSTDCLLRREYPAKFDLTGLWSNIPTDTQLKTLCESAYTAGRKVLDHYQPIDISISIQKKLVKG